MFLQLECQEEVVASSSSSPPATETRPFDKFLLQIPTSTPLQPQLLHRLLDMVSLRQQVLFIAYRIIALMEKSKNDDQTVENGDVCFMHNMLQDWLMQLVAMSKLKPIDAELLRTDDAVMSTDAQKALDTFETQCDNYVQIVNLQGEGDDGALSADMVRWLKVTLLTVRNLKNDMLRKRINDRRAKSNDDNNNNNSKSINQKPQESSHSPSQKLNGARLSLFNDTKTYDGSAAEVDTATTLGMLVNADNEKTKVNGKLIIGDTLLVTHSRIAVDEVPLDKLYSLFDTDTMNHWMQQLSQDQQSRFEELRRTDSFFAANNFLQPQRKRKRENDCSKPIFRRPLKIQEKYLVPVENLELIKMSNLLMDKLRDPKLQQQLIDIDTCRIGSSVERLEMMMRQDEEFARFIDEYLFLIGGRKELELR